MSARLDRMFETQPPRQPFTSLEAIIDDWHYRFGEQGISKGLRDTVVEYCAMAPNLATAIERACDSIRPNGKLHNHQSRVRKVSRDAYVDRLKDDFALKYITNFETLLIICESAAPWGIGPVTIYDVAVRIGAYLGFVPDRLYLHGHVTHGYHALCGYPENPDKKITSVAIKDLPAALHVFSADEIEDFLCTYADYLEEL